MANQVTALAIMIVALIAGSAVSRIYGDNNPIGDRIFLGLLSFPFIVIFVNSIAKDLDLWATLLPAAPVIIYTTLLAKEDWHSNFTKILYISTILVNIVFIYVFFR
jgi:hypothetical protein